MSSWITVSVFRMMAVYCSIDVFESPFTFLLLPSCQRLPLGKCHTLSRRERMESGQRENDRSSNAYGTLTLDQIGRGDAPKLCPKAVAACGERELLRARPKWRAIVHVWTCVFAGKNTDTLARGSITRIGGGILLHMGGECDRIKWVSTQKGKATKWF
jgi:hypothetical protein